MVQPPKGGDLYGDMIRVAPSTFQVVSPDVDVEIYGGWNLGTLHRGNQVISEDSTETVVIQVGYANWTWTKTGGVCELVFCGVCYPGGIRTLPHQWFAQCQMMPDESSLQYILFSHVCIYTLLYFLQKGLLFNPDQSHVWTSHLARKLRDTFSERTPSILRASNLRRGFSS